MKAAGVVWSREGACDAEGLTYLELTPHAPWGLRHPTGFGDPPGLAGSRRRTPRGLAGLPLDAGAPTPRWLRSLPGHSGRGTRGSGASGGSRPGRTKTRKSAAEGSIGSARRPRPRPGPSFPQPHRGPGAPEACAEALAAAGMEVPPRIPGCQTRTSFSPRGASA